jgi:hypothetical protein
MGGLQDRQAGIARRAMPEVTGYWGWSLSPLLRP